REVILLRTPSMRGIPPTWSPDGTLLAFVAPDEDESAEEDSPSSAIHIVQADGGGITRSIPLSGMVSNLAWSPVGGVLLLVGDISDDDESSVQMLSIGEHNGDEEITEMFRGALTADWSPDGEEVVVGDYTSNTILVVGRDQEPRTVAQLTLQPVAVSWSPDGAYVAVTTAGHYWQWYGDALHLVALEAGEVTTVVENEGWVVLSNWSPDGSRLLFTMGPLRQRPGVDLPYADLWLYDVASGELEQLTLGGGFDGLGVWSP
ncbi:MAG: PD40 domain-containing protein, partial [Anaerolineae bacterium]|nr:PD40 domain-containing protein [Anaerolineae bacterium]